jgi:RHS repeat-associated protein
LLGSYNTRLQPNEFKASSSAGTAMDLTYGFVDSSSHNNGNVMGITNNRDTTRSQSFSYDSLNRITWAQTSSTHATSPTNCWGESYQYDNQTTGGAWGNLTSIGVVSSAYTGCTQESLSVTAGTNNQLSATGFTYDPAGNMTGDATNAYGFNAESEIKSAAGMGYLYDGDGNRVEKCTVNGSNCNVTKIYWYGAGTEILDESDASGNITDEYAFFGGKRIAHRNVSSGSIYYYAEDFLGTSRSITTSAGTLCYDADFYPFGGERVVTNTCPQNYKFEGKERDTETGNDDFGARYYNSRLGRWLSADWSSVPAPVPYANLTNPQTLNLYAMARDNPETFADLDGHDCCDLADIINFVGGFANALGSDNLAGAGRQQQNTTAGQAGQKLGDAVATVQGGVETLIGTVGEAGGIALDVTGVGALVGVPANVVSAGVIAHGAATSAEGASNLLKSGVDTLKPGEHAADSVPARGPQRDFTKGEREAVNKAGQETGCHTCGTKDAGTKSGNFVPDHQPPSGLNQNNQPQQLYPQCLTCSQTQGGQVNAAKKKMPDQTQPQ